MRHGSLFSGIGGFDLAAQWMGWENIFQVEIDPFCQKVLEKNFPVVKRYGNIKEFDGTKYRGTIDVLSGGFPCQTFSLAGKGAVDLTLWKEMFRIIREIRPTVVVAENVYGILARKKGMALTTVYDDLESEGYTTMPPHIIPACATGAPHRRDRVWIVAYASLSRFHIDESGVNTDLHRIDQVPLQGRKTISGGAGAPGQSEVITDTIKELVKGGGNNREAHTETAEIKERFKSSGYFLSAWENFPSQPPLCDGDDGVPTWLVRSGTEAGGNAIVPQVAYEIFKSIDLIRKHQIEL